MECLICTDILLACLDGMYTSVMGLCCRGIVLQATPLHNVEGTGSCSVVPRPLVASSWSLGMRWRVCQITRWALPSLVHRPLPGFLPLAAFFFSILQAAKSQVVAWQDEWAMLTATKQVSLYQTTPSSNWRVWLVSVLRVLWSCTWLTVFSHISPSVIPDEFRLSERIQKRCKFYVSLLPCLPSITWRHLYIVMWFLRHHVTSYDVCPSNLYFLLQLFSSTEKKVRWPF